MSLRHAFLQTSQRLLLHIDSSGVGVDVLLNVVDGGVEAHDCRQLLLLILFAPLLAARLDLRAARLDVCTAVARVVTLFDAALVDSVVKTRDDLVFEESDEIVLLQVEPHVHSTSALLDGNFLVDKEEQSNGSISSNDSCLLDQAASRFSETLNFQHLRRGHN